MMHGAKTPAIAESIRRRWTEILSKLSAQFAEKIGDGTIDEKLAQLRPAATRLHAAAVCSKQYRELGAFCARAYAPTRSQSQRLRSWGWALRQYRTILPQGEAGMGDG
jgi:hypothetical protein